MRYNDLKRTKLKEERILIEVKHLTKRYGDHLAVDDLSFTVEQGKIYGFLGPNGVGKSTTMNILTGCLSATEGTVTIDGHDIFEEPIAAKRCIGYLPEIPPLYLDMTPEEYLRFVAKAKGIARAEREEAIETVMERTGTTDVRDRLIKFLSKGYRQRVGLAQAMLGDPKVIILDEPTVGLDPQQIIEMRTLIRELGEEHTVILSSHILSEVSAVCDHALIISHGRLVASDTIENLKEHLSGGATLVLTVKGDEQTVQAAAQALDGVKSATVTKSREENCVEVTLRAEDDRDLREEVFRSFAAQGLIILQSEVHTADLEEVFLSLTADDAPASAPSGDEANAENADAQDDYTPLFTAENGDAAEESKPQEQAADDGKE